MRVCECGHAKFQHRKSGECMQFWQVFLSRIECDCYQFIEAK